MEFPFNTWYMVNMYMFNVNDTEDCAVGKHLRNLTPSMPMQFSHCDARVQRHFLAQTPSLPVTIVHT